MSAIPSTELEREGRLGPSFRRMARRPRWVGALLLVLLIAAGFAALAQWQVGRAVEGAVSTGPDTEKTVALESIARPQAAVRAIADGHLVSTTGRFVPGDSVILSDRLRAGTFSDFGGDRGYWVVGHFVDSDGVSLGVALGWVPTRAAALAAERRVTDADVSLHGRYLASESPDEDNVTAGQVSAVSSGSLINQWHDFSGQVYGGYLISLTPIAGTQRIVTLPPAETQQLNLLNVFYAIEWVLFAGFAFYVWYKLVGDAVEQELEDARAVE